MAICNSFLCSLSQVVLGTEPSFIIQNLVILPGRPPGFLESPTRQVGKGEHLHLSTAQNNWAGGCLVFGVAENSQVGGRLVLGVTQSPGRAGRPDAPGPVGDPPDIFLFFSIESEAMVATTEVATAAAAVRRPRRQLSFVVVAEASTFLFCDTNKKVMLLNQS